jgi:transcriptional regulator with XRE-family HTH domain
MQKKSNFSQKMIYYRKIRGMSQKDLALKTGISPRMITYYEKHISHPSLEKINIIAKALDIDPKLLLEDNEIIFETNKNDLPFDFTKVNTKTLKQISKILLLNKRNRIIIYNMIDALLEKQKEDK